MDDSAHARYDVLRYPDGTNRAVLAGDGQQIVRAHRTESRKEQLIASLAAGFIAVVVVVIGGAFLLDDLVVTLGVGLSLGAVAAVLRAQYWSHEDVVPELVASDASEQVVHEYVEEFDPASVPDAVA